jgi:hypothetical protein
MFKHFANWFQTKLKIIGDHEPVALIYGTKKALFLKKKSHRK